MFPVGLLRLVSFFAALDVMVAVLPNGDIERTLVREVPEGVQSVVERESANSGQKTVERRLIPRGRYGWRIEEERRTVLMAVPGRPTGTIRRAYLLSAFIDATPNPNAPPTPVEAFHFYAPTREAAETLRDRLRTALGGKRP